MDIPEDVAAIEVLARRRDFLSYLDGGPAQKPVMVEELEHSRSTVDRAIRALEDAGFVQRTADGYVTTLVGRLALERYDSFLAESEAILNAKSVLNALAPAVELPLAAATSGEVDAIEDEYQLFEVLADQLRSADQYRAVVPQITDSRHVRRLHVQVDQHALDATLVAPEAAYHRIGQEFPHVASDLDGAASFTALESDRPTIGVVVATCGSRSTAIVVAYEDGEAAGYLRSSAESVVSWARTYVRETVADATETDTLASGDGQSILHLDDQRLPAPLRSQGFEQVDDVYFDTRTRIDPVVAWRAGLQLPEIAAGYDVERFQTGSDGRESMTEMLLSTLAAGDDTVLIGPPGSGKSTVCKQVAYAWFDDQRGTVFYRAGGTARSFENIGSLEAVLDQADGHALVVVEDAVRADANAILEVMQTFSGYEDVTFLLDARDDEWNDPEEIPVDTRTEAFRCRHVQTVEMPPLDEHDQERILDRFEQLGKDTGTLPRQQLLQAELGEEGGAFLFFHRLARYTSPEVTHDSGPSTALDEHVDHVREALIEAGDTALEAGVLANTLNAAGIDVHPGYLHAVDPGSTGVRTAIDILTGDVLFPDEEAGGEAIRSVHDTWSIRFLRRLLTDEGNAATAVHFGRGITALLSLADDQRRREMVVEAAPRSSDAVAAIVADPGQWADEMVERVFELGESYPKLVELYGSSEDGALELPAACSRETRLNRHKWRGHMYNWANRFDDAEPEYEAIVDAIDDPTTSTVEPWEGQLYARALIGLSRTTLSRDSESAREYANRALSVYQQLDDDYGIADARRVLANLAMKMGDVDPLREHSRQAVEHARKTGDPRIEIHARQAVGRLHVGEGDPEAAIDVYEQNLEQARECTLRRQEREALQEIASMSLRLGAFDDVDRYGRQALELSTASGEKVQRTGLLLTLTHGALERAHLGQAEAYLERAERVSADEAFVWTQIAFTNTRGRIATERGEYESAAETFRDVIEQAREQGHMRFVAGGQFYLAQTLLASGDHEQAHDYAERAIATARELDNPEVTARALRVSGWVHLQTGDLVTASEQFEQARETFQQYGDRFRAARCERGLAKVRRARGDDEQACEQLQATLETLRECHAVRIAFEVVEDLADVDGDEWYEVGAVIAADADLDDREAEYQNRAERPIEEQTNVD